MLEFNLTLWILSLALQAMLLAVLLTRGIARRLPVFGSLVAFYIVRSISLHGLAGRIPPFAYTLILTGLAFVDILLQTAVAWELFSSTAIQPLEPGGSARKPPITLLLHDSLTRRLAAFAVLMLAATALALFFATSVHGSPRAPMDRGVLFTSILFILVWLMCRTNSAVTVSRILLGFALYSGAGTVCQMERTRTALHRDITAFTYWSYAGPVTYLIVILLWILLLKGDREAISSPAPDRKRTIRPPRTASASEGPTPLAG